MVSVNKHLLIVENMLNFGAIALHGLYKDLAIQALKVLVQNPTTYLAEKEFSALVDIKTSKRSCVFNETLDDLMQGALEQDIMANWYEISQNIQQQTSHEYICIFE